MVSQLLKATPSGNSLDPIGRFITHRSRMAPPSSEEYDHLFRELSKNSESARAELIERHIRLVASIALKFRNSNVSLEDIMAEGIQGLIIALDKFDHTKGVKLSTYASWWIRQRIQRLIGKMSNAVSVPHDVSQGVRKEARIRADLQVELGRDPTDSEVSFILGSDRNVSKRVKSAPKHSVSLDKPLSEDSDQTLSDLMSDEDSPDTYRDSGSLKDDMEVALKFLDQRERRVLSMRFGIDRLEGMKLDEIACELNVSGERVRQLESIGLRKLRALLLRKGNIDFSKLDKFASADLVGKSEMSPLELSLALDCAN